jgi:hypothetical protein
MTQGALAILLIGITTPLAAQWLNQPTPGIPRTPDGKPNLTAPAPRTPDGKPDISGLWEKNADKYFNNIAADLKPGEVQPWAEALYQKRKVDFGKDSMETLCLPDGPVYTTTPYIQSKIIQTPALVVILNNDMTHRQVFMDGRALEKDPNPSWMGYSVGHWEGDTLVVESAGYSDQTWLDGDGHPHTEALHITERYRRRDFGHMDLDITFDDPKAYLKPWTVARKLELTPDTELLEYVCNENEKDRSHIRPNTVVSAIKVDLRILAKYAGAFQIEREGKVRLADISVAGDQLFFEMDGQGKQPLVPYSQTGFSLSGTWIEFILDAQGSVPEFVMREVEGDSKAVCKPAAR